MTIVWTAGSSSPLRCLPQRPPLAQEKITLRLAESLPTGTSSTNWWQSRSWSW